MKKILATATLIMAAVSLQADDTSRVCKTSHHFDRMYFEGWSLQVCYEFVTVCDDGNTYYSTVCVGAFE